MVKDYRGYNDAKCNCGSSNQHVSINVSYSEPRKSDDHDQNDCQYLQMSNKENILCRKVSAQLWNLLLDDVKDPNIRIISLIKMCSESPACCL